MEFWWKLPFLSSRWGFLPKPKRPSRQFRQWNWMFYKVTSLKNCFEFQLMRFYGCPGKCLTFRTYGNCKICNDQGISIYWNYSFLKVRSLFIISLKIGKLLATGGWMYGLFDWICVVVVSIGVSAGPLNVLAVLMYSSGIQHVIMTFCDT